VAGERVFQSAQEALSKVEGIKEEVEEVQGQRKGRIRVGGSSIAAATFLPEAVQTFKNKHPGVDVILKIQGSESLEKGLLEGDLDLAILGWAPRSPLIAFEPYREEQVVVIAPPNHPLTKKRSVSLELLAREPLITYGKGSLLRAMVEQSFLQNGLPFLPRLEFDVNFGCRDAIKRAVAKGLGVGFHSRCHILSDVEAGRLKLLNVPQLQLKRTTYVAFHKRRHPSSFAQAFAAVLRDL
jgi:DNA-binding transcriptional LysR family regulator